MSCRRCNLYKLELSCWHDVAFQRHLIQHLFLSVLKGFFHILGLMDRFSAMFPVHGKATILVVPDG